MQLRKPDRASGDFRICLKLQWGRNFAVAETTKATGTKYGGYKLQWGRNFAVAETRPT